jgi:methionyl-tRNA synthetase
MNLYMKLLNRVEHLISIFRFKEAMFNVMELSSLGNRFLQENEPWKLIKTDPGAVERIMYTSLQIAGYISMLLKPLLPNTSKKIEKMLNRR